MPPPQPHPPRTPPSLNPPPETIDPVWLLQALALTLLAALICTYATLCLLFYQGEWQLVLHPSRTVDRTPSAAGLAFTSVRFGTFDTGQPQLTGWWLPAQDPAPSNSAPTLRSISKYADFTILYLHDGSGSLSNTLPTLALLHRAGLNVFAIDYRGFGASDSSAHPSEERMAQDAAAALEYLTSTRHIPARAIIPYGTGLGAALAAHLAAAHPELPAVILDNPNPDPASTAAAQTSRIVPVRALFGDRFNMAKPLAALATPKLLIAGGPNAEAPNLQQLPALFKRAASPSFSVTLPPTQSESDYQSALNRFLDQYLPSR